MSTHVSQPETTYRNSLVLLEWENAPKDTVVSFLQLVFHDSPGPQNLLPLKYSLTLFCSTLVS